MATVCGAGSSFAFARCAVSVLAAGRVGPGLCRGLCRGRMRPAHRQHGDHHRIHLPVQIVIDRRHPSIGVGAQRVAKDRHGVGASGLERVDEGGHEGGVVAHPVGAIEDHAHRRPRRIGGGDHLVGLVTRVPQPRLGQLPGRLEPEACEQQCVGHEAHQVGGVGHPALHQVLECLADDPVRSGRCRREVRVGGGLTGEGQQGDVPLSARGGELVEAGPGLSAAQQAHEDQRGLAC